jgi:hypothetical protein
LALAKAEHPKRQRNSTVVTWMHVALRTALSIKVLASIVFMSWGFAIKYSYVDTSSVIPAQKIQLLQLSSFFMKSNRPDTFLNFL